MPRIVKLVVIPLLVVVALGGVALLVFGDTDGGGTPEAVVIEALIPGEEETVLRQSTVGIDLLTGWDADLVVNGVSVPDAQLERIVELGQVRFDPGPGRAIESLQAGRNCMTATYWALAQPDRTFTRSWCFNAT